MTNDVADVFVTEQTQKSTWRKLLSFMIFTSPVFSLKKKRKLQAIIFLNIGGMFYLLVDISMHFLTILTVQSKVWVNQHIHHL